MLVKLRAVTERDNTIKAKLYEEFATQNYKYFVHRWTLGWMDRQADSSIPLKTFILQVNIIKKNSYTVYWYN